MISRLFVLHFSHEKMVSQQNKLCSGLLSLRDITTLKIAKIRLLTLYLWTVSSPSEAKANWVPRQLADGIGYSHGWYPRPWVTRIGTSVSLRPENECKRSLWTCHGWSMNPPNLGREKTQPLNGGFGWDVNNQFHWLIVEEPSSPLLC
jgi:hypothetical protein